MSDRSRYVEVGTAMRTAIRRLSRIRPRPSTIESRVFDAVIALTASYSRLTDRAYLAQIAAEAFGVEHAEQWMLDKTRKALRRLAGWGVIVAEAPRGRPRADHNGPAYLIGLPPAGSAKVGPDPGPLSSAKVGPDPGQKVGPDPAPPTEKVPREEVVRGEEQEQVARDALSGDAPRGDWLCTECDAFGAVRELKARGLNATRDAIDALGRDLESIWPRQGRGIEHVLSQVAAAAVIACDEDDCSARFVADVLARLVDRGDDIEAPGGIVGLALSELDYRYRRDALSDTAEEWWGDHGIEIRRDTEQLPHVQALQRPEREEGSA